MMRSLKLLVLALLTMAARADFCTSIRITVPDVIPTCVTVPYGAFQVSDIAYSMTETGGAQLPKRLDFFANDSNPLRLEFRFEPADILDWQTGPDQTIELNFQITVTPVNPLTFFNAVWSTGVGGTSTGTICGPTCYPINGGFVYLDRVHSWEADIHVSLGPNESFDHVNLIATTTPEPSALLLLATAALLITGRVLSRAPQGRPQPSLGPTSAHEGTIQSPPPTVLAIRRPTTD